MVGFEDPSVLTDFVDAQRDHSMPRKVGEDRCIYRSHTDFGDFKSSDRVLKLVDFGLALHQEDDSELQIYPAQSHYYRAPEVILGAGWTYSMEIWNLGIYVCPPGSCISRNTLT